MNGSHIQIMNMPQNSHLIPNQNGQSQIQLNNSFISPYQSPDKFQSSNIGQLSSLKAPRNQQNINQSYHQPQLLLNLRGNETDQARSLNSRFQRQQLDINGVDFQKMTMSNPYQQHTANFGINPLNAGGNDITQNLYQLTQQKLQNNGMQKDLGFSFAQNPFQTVPHHVLSQSLPRTLQPIGGQNNNNYVGLRNLNKSFNNQSIPILQQNQPKDNFEKAKLALENLQKLDKSILTQFQAYKQSQESQHQYLSQLQHHHFQQQQYQQEQQRQRALSEQQAQQQNRSKLQDEEQKKIKNQADVEIVKIHQLIKTVRNHRDDQVSVEQKLQADRKFIDNVALKVENKCKQNDEKLMKIEVERENLKNLHKFIDIEEQKNKIGSQMQLEQVPASLPSYIYGNQYQPLIHQRGSSNNSHNSSLQPGSYFQNQSRKSSLQTKSDPFSFISNRSHYTNQTNLSQLNSSNQNCVDCNISLNTQKIRDQSFDATVDVPVFQVISVLDWLNHRKHQTAQHEKQMRQKYHKAVEKLNQEKKQRDNISNDWATYKILKLGRLIKE
eukprot:403342183